MRDRRPARSSPSAAPSADEHLRLLLSEQHTVVGSVVGTVEYMAPEQARAQPVDHRADIYAFGLILHDLLLGRSRSRRTASAIAELNLRMLAPPPSPRSEDPSIPEALDSIITRCTQPDANARFATTAELVAALNVLDDDGTPLPIMRRWTWRMGAVAVLLMASLIGLTWWAARPPAVPIQHEPVSLLIADFENHSGDAAFDHTVEPVLKLALEGASFVSAYDRSGIRRSLGVVPPDVLNERTAMELAVKQGVGVVLAGSVSRQRSGYSVSVKATQAVTGRVIANAIERTDNRQDVLGLVTRLATRVREALGDDTTGLFTALRDGNAFGHLARSRTRSTPRRWRPCHRASSRTRGSTFRTPSRGIPISAWRTRGSRLRHEMSTGLRTPKITSRRRCGISMA